MATEAKRFSRRHTTSEAHFTAQFVWRDAHSSERVAERQTERAGRTPEEQLSLLDRRLGVGQGAKKERARLLKAVARTVVAKSK